MRSVVLASLHVLGWLREARSWREASNMCAGRLVSRFALFLLLVCMPRFGLSHATARCNGKVRTLHVMSQSTGILYSPNYPLPYSNSEDCGWVITTKEAGQVVEVQVTEMDLEKDKAHTCVDYLAAYDGDSSKSPLLKKWCGRERTIVHSSGQSLFLHFVSNQLVRQTGFVLKYRITAPYSTDCQSGGVRTLTVMDTPVLLQVAELNDTSECRWRLEGRGKVRLVLDVVHFSGSLHCQDGNLTLTDGADDSAVEVDTWCGGVTPPFSSFYTSGREAIVTTTLLPPARRQFLNVTLELWVRVHAIPTDDECNMNSPEVLEFQKAPLYFPVPFSAWTSGEECTIRVQLLTPNDGGFRVDILTTGNRSATCRDVEEPALWISDGKRVEAECWRGHHPVHWTHTQSISVLPRQNITSFLRVQPTVFPCTGYVIDRLYSGSHSVTNTIRHIGYPRNAQCQFLIDADKGDHPVVQLRTNFLSEEGCGDVVTVYNGSTADGQVLLKHCAGSEDDLREKQVVSPSNALLLVFATDDDDTHGDGLEVQYFSVPEPDICSGGRKTLYATSQVQILQSPNFPKYYHLNYNCYYYIRTNTTGEVIHVKLTSTAFESLNDFLQVFDAGSQNKRLGTISGDERLREFTSSKQTLTIRFYSDQDLSDGGWQLEYRSVPPGQLAADDHDMAFNKLTILVAGSLAVVIVVLIIVIIVTCCKARSSPAPVQL